MLDVVRFEAGVAALASIPRCDVDCFKSVAFFAHAWKQKGVTVKSIDLDHAELDDNTGMLTWNLQLKPGETKIISFTYKVEYNKDMDVL